MSYDRAEGILRERRPALERIVKRLIEKESLGEGELNELLKADTKEQLTARL